ncbi:MAG: GNAT family N-acetyltransferase [Bacilli bacterium]|nr:GNAT family N-acetyltransferase [Bacilli bacterium]
MKSFEKGNIRIKLAETKEEYEGLYRLRYFDLLLNYNINNQNDEQLDTDAYDKVCDHLIAVDTNTNEVVGTYRIIKKSHLLGEMPFLTESEFDLTPLKKYELMELGRAVVKEEYRDGSVIGLLWSGIIRYAIEENMEYMVGTASFHGTDYREFEDVFSYLYHNNLSPTEIRCNVNQDSAIDMQILNDYQEEVAKKNMPPLIKGYLRLGATIGNGIYIDRDFNSLDVLIVLKISEINPRYLKRYL